MCRCGDEKEKWIAGVMERLRVWRDCVREKREGWFGRKDYRKAHPLSSSRAQWGKIWDIHLITVPGFRSLLAPSRNVKVTVPGVVGSHSIVVGWPAVTENPGGILNALSAAWASRDENRSVTSGRIESCIIFSGQGQLSMEGRRDLKSGCFFE